MPCPPCHPVGCPRPQTSPPPGPMLLPAPASPGAEETETDGEVGPAAAEFRFVPWPVARRKRGCWSWRRSRCRGSPRPRLELRHDRAGGPGMGSSQGTHSGPGLLAPPAVGSSQLSPPVLPRSSVLATHPRSVCQTAGLSPALCPTLGTRWVLGRAAFTTPPTLPETPGCLAHRDRAPGPLPCCREAPSPTRKGLVAGDTGSGD